MEELDKISGIYLRKLGDKSIASGGGDVLSFEKKKDRGGEGCAVMAFLMTKTGPMCNFLQAVIKLFLALIVVWATDAPDVLLSALSRQGW